MYMVTVWVLRQCIYERVCVHDDSGCMCKSVIIVHACVYVFIKAVLQQFKQHYLFSEHYLWKKQSGHRGTNKLIKLCICASMLTVCFQLKAPASSMKNGSVILKQMDFCFWASSWLISHLIKTMIEEDNLSLLALGTSMNQHIAWVRITVDKPMDEDHFTVHFTQVLWDLLWTIKTSNVKNTHTNTHILYIWKSLSCFWCKNVVFSPVVFSWVSFGLKTICYAQGWSRNEHKSFGFAVSFYNILNICLDSI